MSQKNSDKFFLLILVSFVLSLVLFNYKNIQTSTNSKINEDFTPYSFHNFYKRKLTPIDSEAYEQMCEDGGDKFKDQRDNPDIEYDPKENEHSQKVIDLLTGDIDIDSDEFDDYLNRMMVIVVFGCFSLVAILIWIFYCFFCCCDCCCNIGLCKSKACCCQGCSSVCSMVSFLFIAISSDIFSRNLLTLLVFNLQPALFMKTGARST